MAHFQSASEIKTFASARQQCGISRWLPIGKNNPNGLMTVLPGMYDFSTSFFYSQVEMIIRI